MSNGCFNRKPFERLIPLPATYTISIEGHHVVCEAVQMIPFVFAKDCQYTLTELGKADKRCFKDGEPCKWRKE